jgi:hypothetical protein
MTKRRNKPATPAEEPARPQVDDSPATVARAVDELGIDVPIYAARVVGDRLELRLYGGAIAYWPPEPETAAMAPDVGAGLAPDDVGAGLAPAREA